MGVLMSASGYVGGADVQVDSAIMMIRVLASVAPLALMLVVAVILRFYTVDKQMPQTNRILRLVPLRPRKQPLNKILAIPHNSNVGNKKRLMNIHSTANRVNNFKHNSSPQNKN